MHLSLKRNPLQIMMIEKDHVVCTAMDGNDRFIIDEIIPEYYNQIRVFLKSLGLKSEDYRAILVHPWQYDHTIGKYFEAWIAKNINSNAVYNTFKSNFII